MLAYSGFSGVRWVCFGIFCVLGVLHGDLQWSGRQGAAPCQYNNVYWDEIYLPVGQSYLCVLFQ